MTDYKPGQIWGDKDGENWKVLSNGRLLWAGAAENDESFRPGYVEVEYGPLTLVKDVPMADWEKALLEKGWDGPPEERITPSDPEGLGQYYQRRDWNEGLVSSSTPHVTFEVEVPVGVFDRVGDETFVKRSLEIYEEALNVLLKKNADYGPKNISQSPGGPLNGLRVRMWDKTARINNLVDSGVEPENESLRDSYLDLLNYSAIALMVLDGHWPGSEATD